MTAPTPSISLWCCGLLAAMLFTPPALAFPTETFWTCEDGVTICSTCDCAECPTDSWCTPAPVESGCSGGGGLTCEDGVTPCSTCDCTECPMNAFCTESCSDGVLNQDEEDIDCGGASCAPCYGTCEDGVTPCMVCDCTDCPGDTACAASCSDGVLNQDEEDIDCGGASCAPCYGTCEDGVTPCMACDCAECPGDSACVPPSVCTPGETRCATLFEGVEVCNADGTEWQITVGCGPGQRCEFVDTSGAHECVASDDCRDTHGLGYQRCEEPSPGNVFVMECEDDGEFGPVQSCNPTDTFRCIESPPFFGGGLQTATCECLNPGCAPNDCEAEVGAGGRRCEEINGSTYVQECQDDGSFQVVELCAPDTIMYCGQWWDDAADRSEAECVCWEPSCRVCEPGATRCLVGNGNDRVETCNDEGSAWEETEECGDAELCEYDDTLGARCLMPLCPNRQPEDRCRELEPTTYAPADDEADRDTEASELCGYYQNLQYCMTDCSEDDDNRLQGYYQTCLAVTQLAQDVRDFGNNCSENDEFLDYVEGMRSCLQRSSVTFNSDCRSCSEMINGDPDDSGSGIIGSHTACNEAEDFCSLSPETHRCFANGMGWSWGGVGPFGSQSPQGSSRAVGVCHLLAQGTACAEEMDTADYIDFWDALCTGYQEGCIQELADTNPGGMAGISLADRASCMLSCPTPGQIDTVLTPICLMPFPVRPIPLPPGTCAGVPFRNPSENLATEITTIMQGIGDGAASAAEEQCVNFFDGIGLGGRFP